MHEALLPPSKAGQDGGIGTIALGSSRPCWSLSNIIAPLKQQLNEKVEKNISANIDVRNVDGMHCNDESL